MKALEYDTYKIGGDISCTTLIDAPQIRVLKKKYSSDIVTDASEMLWALMGTAMHHILERSHITDKRKDAFLTVIDTIRKESSRFGDNDQKKLKELSDKIMQLAGVFFPEMKNRYIWEMTMHFEYNGMVLYGTFDLYDLEEETLYDYKVCSVWAFKPESQLKWNAQTNVYAFMLREAGYVVNQIKIVAIFRDWQASKAEFAGADYPKHQMLTIPIPVIDQEKMRTYIQMRMDLHIKAEQGEVPDCTDKERWATPNSFAVKKKGIKKALRVFTSQQRGSADEYVKQNNAKNAGLLFIENRIGESKRCDSYCPVRDFCPQKKKLDAAFAQQFVDK